MLEHGQLWDLGIGLHCCGAFTDMVIITFVIIIVFIIFILGNTITIRAMPERKHFFMGGVPLVVTIIVLFAVTIIIMFMFIVVILYLLHH